MAINIQCLNSECKYYWEDCCQRNFEESRIEIDETGHCKSFEKGVCEWYEMEELAEALDEQDEMKGVKA
ncbi:hypothetical protein [Anaerotignum propionicum]|uniref:hypothetical protein n=1 Tax=Anaerotignum propionicum TaxID=28446 RepID=UPI0028A1E268|nr:hypothetical protein [Anaerotignum propionicum]